MIFWYEFRSEQRHGMNCTREYCMDELKMSNFNNFNVNTINCSIWIQENRHTQTDTKLKKVKVKHCSLKCVLQKCMNRDRKRVTVAELRLYVVLLCKNNSDIFISLSGLSYFWLSK